ncbi:unnamed protein product [Pedinophyceae sp. YPF-701]|nr:unnamed protein product [Pedinophyceae sp. YPF-701]
MLQRLASILTPDTPPEALSAALDAVGTLCARDGGADMAMAPATGLCRPVAELALGHLTVVVPEVRIAALHALASALGADRHHGGGGPGTAVLGDAAEEEMRISIMEVTEGMLGEALAKVLKKPDLDVRVAAYRFIVGAALRQWGAAAAVASSELLSAITDAVTEVEKRGCEWRFAAVSALSHALPPAETGDRTQTLVHAAAALAAARSAGPYGRGSSAAPVPQVATIDRTGGV